MRKRYLFLGDSITDAKRLWLPDYQGLGNGYVFRVAKALAAEGQYPEIINKGHDGFTVHALLRNLSEDCLAYEPDFVTVLVGINNIGMAFHTGQTIEKQHFYEDYRKLLTSLSGETRAKVLCMGPFVFPKPQEYSLWLEAVLSMEEGIRELTACFCQVRFLPLQEWLNEAAGRLGYEAVTTDGIHLTPLGHGLLAGHWMDFVRSQPDCTI